MKRYQIVLLVLAAMVLLGILIALGFLGTPHYHAPINPHY